MELINNNSISTSSVRTKSATVDISSDNLRSSGLPGAATPVTTLLVDAIGLKVNESVGPVVGATDGIPDGAFETDGVFDGVTDGIPDGAFETDGPADGATDGIPDGARETDGVLLGYELSLGASVGAGPPRTPHNFRPPSVPCTIKGLVG